MPKNICLKVDEANEDHDTLDQGQGEGQEEDQIKIELSQEDWDLRIQEAFKRTILEVVQDKDLPLEPSDFQKMLQEFTLEDSTKIDLKNSQYKKIGKLLEKMSC